MKLFLGMMLSVVAVPASAGDSIGTSPLSASAFQAIVGLVAVLVLMAVLTWVLKRVGLARVMGNSSVKVIGGVSVGGRERVLVVEAGDQWIVVGVSPGRVNALTTMPRQEVPTRAQGAAKTGPTFPLRLRQSIETQHGE
jgi:flagellar protein FliO/FliZ